MPDPLDWVTREYGDTRGHALNQLENSLHKIRRNKGVSLGSSLFSFVLYSSRSGPAPSPKTRTRVMTTPATVSSFIWMQAMRFSLSWMGARLTEATATNTAPSLGSSSTLTEGGFPSGGSQTEDGPFLAPAAGFTLPIATDPRWGFSCQCFQLKRRRGDWNRGSAAIGDCLPPHHTSIVYRVPTPPFRRTVSRAMCHAETRRHRPRRHVFKLSFHIKILGGRELRPRQCL